MTALEAPVDPAVVERAAEAAYLRVMMHNDIPHYEPWEKLPDYWKRLYRVQVRAVIDLIGGAS